MRHTNTLQTLAGSADQVAAALFQRITFSKTRSTAVIHNAQDRRIPE
jgi:hypothetical protein